MNEEPTIACKFGKAGAAKSAAGLRREFRWTGWLPLLILPVMVILFRNAFEPWAFMWALAIAIFLGCKWLTYSRATFIPNSISRRLGYLIAWPGFDAQAFFQQSARVEKPRRTAWMAAVLKITFGAALTWGVARKFSFAQPILAGWVGLVGLVFVLHFGCFDLLSVAWRGFGVNAQPIMRAPIMATSLADFWGHRWNAAFNRLAHDLVFKPLHRRIGIVWATMLVFLISGLIHDLVISLPARAGFGLPTIYFLIQGMGLLFERSAMGKSLGLGRGFAGRVFMFVVTAGPAFWLFHPAFITRVILPFLKVIHAL